MKHDLLDWEPPPLHSYKLNVDAAIFFDQAKVDLGAIVRDWIGKALLVASMAEEHVAQPKTIEALPILRWLQLSLHQGFDPLTIESDCLLVVEEVLKQ